MTALLDLSISVAAYVRMTEVIPAFEAKLNSFANSYDWYPEPTMLDETVLDYSQNNWFHKLGMSMETIMGNLTESYMSEMFSAARTHGLVAPRVLDFLKIPTPPKKRGKPKVDYDLIETTGTTRIEVTQTRTTKNYAGQLAAAGAQIVCIQEDVDGGWWLGRQSFSRKLFGRGGGFDGWVSHLADLNFVAHKSRLIRDFRTNIQYKLRRHATNYLHLPV